MPGPPRAASRAGKDRCRDRWAGNARRGTDGAPVTRARRDVTRALCGREAGRLRARDSARGAPASPRISRPGLAARRPGRAEELPKGVIVKDRPVKGGRGPRPARERGAGWPPLRKAIPARGSECVGPGRPPSGSGSRHAEKHSPGGASLGMGHDRAAGRDGGHGGQAGDGSHGVRDVQQRD